MEETKPKRKRRTKEEIRLDNLKLKKEKFMKEYPNMTDILTVQETAKLLKLGVKEVREQCINQVYECTPHETIKNQFNVDTYQFVDHENFKKFTDKFLSDKQKQEEINQVIQTKEVKKEEQTKESIKEPIKELEELVDPLKQSTKKSTSKKETVVQEELKNEITDESLKKEKTKRTRKKDESKKVEPIIDEVKKEEVTETLPEEKVKKPRNSRKEKEEINELHKEVVNTSPEAPESSVNDFNKADDEEVVTGIKTNNKVLNSLFSKRKSGNRNSVQMDELSYKQKNEFVIPSVPASAHYLVNDKVRLFKEPVLGQDVDEETLEYLEAYKKNLLGQKGVIRKITYTGQGHPIYEVYFEKQKEDMYCYHHYLTWIGE